MPKIAYVPKGFHADTRELIEQAEGICASYAAQGFDLTLRGLYYQLVTRNAIRNSMQEYNRLKAIVNDARLAGLIDWNHIVDATRNLADLPHWDSPQQILEAVASQYRTHRWASQPKRVEVWIEKDAMVGVIAGTCRGLDVPYFSCRGYTSQSEMWGAAQRHRRYARAGQQVVVIHLGDHDPSGIDMTRDIRDRLALFGASTRVQRIALTMDQVRQYGPPPNPAKVTDARYESYRQVHGEDSWELDALAPDVIAALITAAVTANRDDAAWQAATAEMSLQRFLLEQTEQNWDQVIGFLRARAGGDGAEGGDGDE